MSETAKQSKAPAAGDTSAADRQTRLARLATRKDVTHPVTSSERPPRAEAAPDATRVAERAARKKGGK